MNNLKISTLDSNFKKYIKNLIKIDYNNTLSISCNKKNNTNKTLFPHQKFVKKFVQYHKGHQYNHKSVRHWI